MAVPRIMHVSEKLRNMGPCVPAPVDVYGPGPTPESGVLLYKAGDPMPINEAAARGFAAQPAAEPEPGPRHASSRNRTIRVADRAGTQDDTVTA